MKWRITTDETSFCIERKHVVQTDGKLKPDGSQTKKGDVYWTKDSWPGSLESSAKLLLDLIVHDKASKRDANSVKNLIAAIEEAQIDIADIVYHFKVNSQC